MGREKQFPAVKSAACILAHVPGMVKHGWKPKRELHNEPGLDEALARNLRCYEDAVVYAPHQVFIGAEAPEALWDLERPWWAHRRRPGSARFGSWGEIMPEEEFLGLLRWADRFRLVVLEQSFWESVRCSLSRHPLFTPAELEPLGEGCGSLKDIGQRVSEEEAAPLYHQGRMVGCVCRGHEEDPALAAAIVLENLACKASGALAMKWLAAGVAAEQLKADSVQYVINSGEEASGDRYQRGAGNLAKAMAELAGYAQSTGGDLKAYCCAPIHSLVMAGGLVAAGIFEHVVVVGGGSLAKLGMKIRGHLAHEMPILEDVLAAFAVWVGPYDGRNPVIRLDAVGRHRVSDGGAAQQVAEALVRRPLGGLGKKITDVDRFAVELHNPDITEPGGSGNVPRANYRTLASLAAVQGLWPVERIGEFEKAHGLPGFAPTQGHVASAVPYLGHARRAMLAGKLRTAMFIGKGSLFLGKMTNLSDGMSFLLEAP